MNRALSGGFSVGLGQVAADVHDVDGPGARRHQVGPRQLLGVLGNANDAPLTRPPPTGPNLPASAGSANTARMPLPPLRLRSSPLPTVIEAGEMVAYHSAKRATSATASPHVSAAPLDRPRPRQRHELLEATHPPLDERAIEGTAALEIGGHRPRQHHVGAGAQGQVQIGLLGDLGAARIDHHQLAAGAARLVESGVMCRFDHVTLLPTPR